MTRRIDSVAVLGGGTMGGGIAGACAQAGCKVLLLDVSYEAAQKALDRIVNGRPPAVDDAEAAGRIELGSFDDLARIADYDWICEAVIEDLATKRALFEKLEAARELVGGHQHDGKDGHRHAHAEQTAERAVAEKELLQLLTGAIRAADHR